jgi:hypothetical protein
MHELTHPLAMRIDSLQQLHRLKKIHRERLALEQRPQVRRGRV